MNYVKAVSENDSNIVHVYESPTAAAELLRIDRRTLTDFLKSKKKYKGFYWSYLPPAEWGTWSVNGDEQQEDVQEITPTEDLGKNGRCNGKIIARDLKTGEQTIYESATRAAAFHDLCPKSLRNNLLDKPRHIKGKHFRKVESERYWDPPDYFVYDDETFVKTPKDDYVVCLMDNGQKSMYENITNASELENVQRSKIQQFINTGKKIDGMVWRSASLEDYDQWIYLNDEQTASYSSLSA